MNWNQPICDACWHDLQPERRPVRLATPIRRSETCSMCGKTTDSGIYVRADPRIVAFPRAEPDNETAR